MTTARSLLSATVFGCMAVSFMFMIGCASTRAVVEPPMGTASPLPVVDPAPSPPTGPPPGYVTPENYWVREKIILGEVTTIIEQPMSPEPAPPVSATPKSLVNKGKKNKKTGKRFSEREATRTSAVAEALVHTPCASFMPAHPVATFSYALRYSMPFISIGRPSRLRAASIRRTIGETLTAYREAARTLLEGKYAAQRDLAPPHMQGPCSIFVLRCHDGIFVRYDLVSQGDAKTRCAELDTTLSEVAPQFSEGVIHFPKDPNTYVPSSGGPEISLHITDAAGGLRKLTGFAL
jgi:hypothetical protein